MSMIPKCNRAHILNEWADATANGVQYLRNIRDGLGNVDDAIRAMELNVERIRALSAEDQIKPTVAEAIAYYQQSEASYEVAEEALRVALCDATHRLRPYGRAEFERFRIGDGGKGLTICYHSMDYGSDYIDLTEEDLQAADPAQSYLDRKEAAAKEEASRNALRRQIHERQTLTAQLAAMTPEARAELLAEAEKKA